MVETKEWTLTAFDRCDGPSCGAQAYIKVMGMTGEILFCSHHFNKFDGEKLRAFAFDIIDERDRLIEERTKED